MLIRRGSSVAANVVVNGIVDVIILDVDEVVDDCNVDVVVNFSLLLFTLFL